MSFNILQVSDTHLSRSHPLFQFNFEVTLREIERLQPDLVVYTGDLALNGPESPDDVRFAHQQLARTPCPWFAVPGNHDVGMPSDSGYADHAITTERLAVFREAFGGDRFCTDIGSWRMVGINSLLIGSGLAAEQEQFDWLDTVLDCAMPVAVFLHFPVFVHAVEGEDMGHHALSAPSRKRLLDAFARSGNVRLVGSGHLHQSRSLLHDGIRFEWAPSSAFVIRSAPSEALKGRMTTGFLVHTFEGDAVSTHHHEPALMMNVDISNWTQATPHGYYQVIRHPWPVGDLREAVTA